MSYNLTKLVAKGRLIPIYAVGADNLAYVIGFRRKSTSKKAYKEADWLQTPLKLENQSARPETRFLVTSEQVPLPVWNKFRIFTDPANQLKTESVQPELIDNPIRWNPGNKVVQDHRDGTIDDAATAIERKRRGMSPWTPELAEIETRMPRVP